MTGPSVETPPRFLVWPRDPVRQPRFGRRMGHGAIPSLGQGLDKKRGTFEIDRSRDANLHLWHVNTCAYIHVAVIYLTCHIYRCIYTCIHMYVYT